MNKCQIAVIVGSLRKDSFNQKLANGITRLAPAELTFKQVQISDLPLYNQDDDANQAESVKRLKSDLTAAQGLLFVTPEYNRSMPGVLKNAIDNASRPYGQSAWASSAWANSMYVPVLRPKVLVDASVQTPVLDCAAL
jgi:chromate reductase